MIKRPLVFLFFILGCFPAAAFALNEIQIDKVKIQNQSADRYDVNAVIFNQTSNSREVTVRAQIFFFEKAAPKGQRPAMILRKDETWVLRPRERRKISIRLLNEGSFPKERLRLEPEVRLRRQRVWNY